MKNAATGVEDVKVSETQTESVSVSTEVEALSLVKSYVGWASGVALLPVPMADLVAISLTQLRMVQKLSELYKIPFNQNLAKNIIGSLVGSVTPLIAAAPLASLLKMIPVVGTAIGSVTLPIVTGASTYALGKVFIQHFESGGTFLDMDPSTVAAYFKEQYSSKVQAKQSSAA